MCQRFRDAPLDSLESRNQTTNSTAASLDNCVGFPTRSAAWLCRKGLLFLRAKKICLVQVLATEKACLPVLW